LIHFRFDLFAVFGIGGTGGTPVVKGAKAASTASSKTLDRARGGAEPEQQGNRENDRDPG
jgi:hypothetical protein